MTGEKCKRQLVVIGNENFYLLVGDTFVDVTVPRENDPAMNTTRVIVETICGAITALMELRAEEKENAKLDEIGKK